MSEKSLNSFVNAATSFMFPFLHMSVNL